MKWEEEEKGWKLSAQFLARDPPQPTNQPSKPKPPPPPGGGGGGGGGSVVVFGGEGGLPPQVFARGKGENGGGRHRGRFKREGGVGNNNRPERKEGGGKKDLPRGSGCNSVETRRHRPSSQSSL